MFELINGVRRFKQRVMPGRRRFFSRLAREQAPKALWIGGSDSRIDPHLITQSEPGTLFVARNPGSVVPPHPEPSGVGAAIEFAVEVLGVRDVVICGHSDCGIMRAALAPQSVSALPHMCHVVGQAWQPPAETIAPSLNHAIEQNVLLQLGRVSQYPSVSRRLAERRITLHGWVYEIRTGDVKAYDGKTFVNLVDVGLRSTRRLSVQADSAACEL